MLLIKYFLGKIFISSPLAPRYTSILHSSSIFHNSDPYILNFMSLLMFRQKYVGVTVQYLENTPLLRNIWNAHFRILGTMVTFDNSDNKAFGFCL